MNRSFEKLPVYYCLQPFISVTHFVMGERYIVTAEELRTQTLHGLKCCYVQGQSAPWIPDQVTIRGLRNWWSHRQSIGGGRL